MDKPVKSRFLDYLPGIFHASVQAPGGMPTAPAEGKGEEPFLQEFLRPFEQIFDEYEALLSTLDRYVAPELTPAADFLPWLAAWVALLLDEEWDESQRRRLIGDAVELYRWRGTQYGLKRYLQLYTGLPADAIDIYEAAWPAGMQIGTASQIGRALAPTADDESGVARPLGDPGEVVVDKENYYVVDTKTPPALPTDIDIPELPATGVPLRLYFATDRVEQVDIEENGVRLLYRTLDGGTETLFYPVVSEMPSEPNIQRRSELVNYHYRFSERSNGTDPHAYAGGSFLIERVGLPYRFVVRIRLSAAEYLAYTDDGHKLAKVRSILDLEKPAHTEYYLQLVPEKRQVSIAWMQIEVHSNIGLDTTMG